MLLHFGKGRSKPLNDIEIGNHKLKAATSTKFLGLWIDNKLKWREHVQKLLTKLQSKKALLQRSKNLLTAHARRILYFAQIQSNLSYGLLIWGSMITKEDFNKLEKMQNKCVQLIEPSKQLRKIYEDHSILKLENLVKLENAKTWYKYYQNTLPVNLMGMMKEDHNKSALQKQHGYNTRKKKEINLPLATCQAYKSSFYVEGLKTYSNLPSEIKRKEKLHCFVDACKKYLLTAQ